MAFLQVYKVSVVAQCTFPGALVVGSCLVVLELTTVDFHILGGKSVDTG